MLTRLLPVILAALAVYVFVNDPNHVFTGTVVTSNHGVAVSVNTYDPTQNDQTSGHNIFNPNATLDTAQIDNEEETPNQSCANIDWQHGGDNGGPIIPYDANEDGYIDCTSDIELGA